MKRYILFVIIALLCIELHSQDKKDEKSLFNLDALNFYSPDSTKSRVDLYFEFPFENINFLKNKEKVNEYLSAFNISVIVKDESKNVVIDQMYKETIYTSKTDLDYLNKNSKVFSKNIFLFPGNYSIHVSAEEINTRKQSEKNLNFTVKDFLISPITVSDVMTVSKVTDKNGKKYITPLVSRNAGFIDTLSFFYFIYVNNSVSFLIQELNVENSINEKLFTIYDTLDLKKGIEFDNQIIKSIPTSNMVNDNYKITIKVYTLDYSTSSVSEFVFKWLNFPVDLTNMKNAIEQLQYIASDNEIRKIKQGKTNQEQQKRFMEFWKTKDPSPNTDKNEVMIEYYHRIDYANKHFQTDIYDGWKTDMGMVFVIFGMPSNIERHPYEMDSKPYEIWDYYEVNKQFIFVDYSGFGDYRLITPLWEDKRFRF
jgi:GWxTD domain-containing protein